jgi:hypothetical protein
VLLTPLALVVLVDERRRTVVRDFGGRPGATRLVAELYRVRALVAVVLIVLATCVPCAAAGARHDAAVPTGLWQAAAVLRDPGARWTLGDVERRDAAFRPAAMLVPSPFGGALAPATLWFRLTAPVAHGPW